MKNSTHLSTNTHAANLNLLFPIFFLCENNYFIPGFLVEVFLNATFSPHNMYFLINYIEIVIQKFLGARADLSSFARHISTAQKIL